MINQNDLELERAQERVTEIRSIVKIIFYRIAYPIFALYILFDWIFASEVWFKLLLTRLMIFPIGVACIFLCRRAKSPFQIQIVCLVVASLIGLLTDVVIWNAHNVNSHNYVGLIFLTMGASCFVPFERKFWVLTVLATYLPYYIGWFLFFSSPDDTTLLIQNSFYIFSAIIIAFFIAEYNENLRQKELSSRLLLNNELETRNQIIESKTKEALALELEAQESRIISDIARQVSHDIRSPISAMNLVVGSLKELPPAKTQLLSDSIRRINEIANDLLNRSKNIIKQAAAAITDLSLLDLHKLIDSVLMEKRVQCPSGQVLFKLEALSDEEIFVSVEPVRLKRILSNLLANSIEALDGEGRVEVHITRSSNELVFEIRDNGCGIPMDILPKLMTEGFTFGKSNGNGLGLYSAKRDIESWGGSIRITSAVESGTTVMIRLPLND